MQINSNYNSSKQTNSEQYSRYQPNKKHWHSTTLPRIHGRKKTPQVLSFISL